MKCPRCKSSMVNANDHYHLSFRGHRCPICGEMAFDKFVCARPLPPINVNPVFRACGRKVGNMKKRVAP